MAVLLVVPASSSTPGPALAAQDMAPPVIPQAGGDALGRELLVRTFAGPAEPVAGTVAVIVLDDDGPFVSELDVTATPTGEMIVGRSRSFAVGRTGDNAFLARDGTLLQLGTVIDADDAVEALLANYDVHHVPGADLETGRAEGVDLFDRSGVRRERLWVDLASGVVVRRETYGLDGTPRRLVAFTELTLVAAQRDSMMSGDEVLTGLVEPLESDALGTMGRTGWHVPDALGPFTLERGFAVGEGGDASSLHLVYGDGLYSTSVYQQPGTVDPSALRGAVEVVADGRHLWRWPGAQPERLVWSADGMTFTVVGDASADAILRAIDDLPQQSPPSTAERVGRGLKRVASWVNPFA